MATGAQPGYPLSRRSFAALPCEWFSSVFDKPTHWLYAKPDIRAVKDLKGRKVAVDGLGGTLESLLRSVLEKNGLEAGRDVPFLAIGTPPGRFLALTSGAVDASLFTFPLNFRAEEAGFRELVNFVKQDIVSLTGSIVIREASDAPLVEKLVRGAVSEGRQTYVKSRRKRTRHQNRRRHSHGRGDAAILDARSARLGTARARLPAHSRQAARGKTGGLSRHRGASRADRRILRASAGPAPPR